MRFGQLRQHIQLRSLKRHRSERHRKHMPESPTCKLIASGSLVKIFKAKETDIRGKESRHRQPGAPEGTLRRRLFASD